jgi:cathepsin L
VANTGPISVAIEADQMSFQLYSGGVLTGSCGTNLDHGVLAVGFGSESGTDYWKVKNSWGASWGANGYILIQRSVNKCGIADGPPSYPTVNGGSLSEGNDEWEEYKQQFGKVYNGDEEETRKAAFMENKKMWGQHESGAVLGATQFSDLTLEEFQALNIRGLNPSMKTELPNLGEHSGEAWTGATIDWTTKGAVTPVKDQGQCGSCWAFSTTGGLEGAWELSSGNLVSMSEQQFVDCSKQNSGCNGGLMETAFSWAKTQAIATESSYSYTARDGSCKSSFTTAIPRGGVTGYKTAASASALTSALQNNPVSVAIEADQSVFQQYKSGTITSGCGSNLDHGVLAVGINSDGSIKVKNSWGTSWGANGYVNIATNQCGIATDGSYPQVSSSVSV